MTQLECEKKILSLLEEVERVFNEYGESDHLSISICDGHISAFAFVDESCEKYALNLTRYSDGEVSFRGDLHD